MYLILFCEIKYKKNTDKRQTYYGNKSDTQSLFCVSSFYYF